MAAVQAYHRKLFYLFILRMKWFRYWAR